MLTNMKSSIIEFFLHYLTYSAFIKNETVIHIFYSKDYNNIHLTLLLVNYANRRKGYGTKVINHIKKIANFFHVPIVTLPTAIDTVNLESVQKFYTKQGFSPFTHNYYKYSK